MSDKSTSTIYRELRENYRGSHKSTLDAENYFYLWYRPISFFPSAVLIRLGMSANNVTVCGGVVLLMAFALLSLGKFQAGACLYLLAYLIDFVDGNIARYVGKPTYFGRMIDGLVDSLTFLLFIAIGIGNAFYGNALFGGLIEGALGMVTAFIFLFRSYFYLRVSYILNQARALEAVDSKSKEIIQGPNAINSDRSGVINYGKKIYFGLISGMPLFLMLAVAVNAVSYYLALYFLVFVLATSFEVVYGLRRVWLKDRCNI